MKKIVALVLSLALALSLCTVAFAATTKLAVYGVNSNKNAVEKLEYYKDVKEIPANTTKGNIAYYTWTYTYDEECYLFTNTDGEADFAPTYLWNGLDQAGVDKLNAELGVAAWVWADTAETKIKTEVKTFTDRLYGIPCEYADADAAIHDNGTFVDYVMVSGSDELAFYDYEATAQSKTSAKPNCTTTQYLADGYVDEDGEFWIAAESGKKLNVNGKIVIAKWVDDDTNYVIHASHVFAKGVKNDKMGYDVATCLICKGEFACTNSDAVATKTGYKISTSFAYNTVNANNVYKANKYDNGYDFNWGQTYASDYAYCWALKAGTTEEAGKTTTDTTKDGVNSAKTFDAGIAMYVGMSLLSVAGSAVVIGKKKEF